jgi:hypothetical protein
MTARAGPHAPRVERRLDALDALRVEPPPLEPALRERLDDANRAEPFLDDRHDLALPPPHFAARLLDGAAQPHREHHDERRHRQRHQREAPVQGEHPQASGDRRDVDQDVEQRRRREVLHRVDVVDNRADKRPYLRAGRS